MANPNPVAIRNWRWYHWIHCFGFGRYRLVYVPSDCFLDIATADHSTVEVLKSNRPISHKILWSLLVFLFPIGGIIIYWLFSNRAAHNQGAGYEPISN